MYAEPCGLFSQKKLEQKINGGRSGSRRQHLHGILVMNMMKAPAGLMNDGVLKKKPTGMMMPHGLTTTMTRTTALMDPGKMTGIGQMGAPKLMTPATWDQSQNMSATKRLLQ